MGALIAILRCAVTVLAFWSLGAVIAAFPVAAVFRMQARAERIWRELERRRAWREAAG